MGTTVVSKPRTVRYSSISLSESRDIFEEDVNDDGVDNADDYCGRFCFNASSRFLCGKTDTGSVLILEYYFTNMISSNLAHRFTS